MVFYPLEIDLEYYLFDLKTTLFEKNIQLSISLSGELDSRFWLGIPPLILTYLPFLDVIIPTNV